MNSHNAIKLTQEWLSTIVIGLQLCPFAKKPFNQQTIRYVASSAQSDEERIDELTKECRLLDENTKVETSLIIYPNGLDNFFDYSQLIDWANAHLKKQGWQGIYQIATFHPSYTFANTHSDARENLTNRAPYPILHLLREDDLQEAIDQFPDTQTIPDKNIATMNNLTEQDVKQLFYYLLKDKD